MIKELVEFTLQGARNYVDKCNADVAKSVYMLMVNPTARGLDYIKEMFTALDRLEQNVEQVRLFLPSREDNDLAVSHHRVLDDAVQLLRDCRAGLTYARNYPYESLVRQPPAV